jgi:hypothetical protein
MSEICWRSGLPIEGEPYKTQETPKYFNFNTFQRSGEGGEEVDKHQMDVSYAGPGSAIQQLHGRYRKIVPRKILQVCCTSGHGNWPRARISIGNKL